MEDWAIDGEDWCLVALTKLGGGEQGLRYVIANREEMRKRILADAKKDRGKL